MEKNYFIAGLVAGEGYFGVIEYRPGKKRFCFSVAVADDDIEMLEIIKSAFQYGKIRTYPPRKYPQKGYAVYSIQNMQILHQLVMPFFDKYLIGTRKKKQYELWRIQLADAY